MSGVAHSDSAPMPNPFAKFANANAVVLAVQAGFATPGHEVRVTVYNSEDDFLEMAAMKHRALVNADGVAIVTLRGLEPGEYSFVAYYDENGDGKLNRSVIGTPKEPLIFSNDIRPKLRKPTFDETKVEIADGAVVVMTMES